LRIDKDSIKGGRYLGHHQGSKFQWIE